MKSLGVGVVEIQANGKSGMVKFVCGDDWRT
jgi:hypothetical protein